MNILEIGVVAGILRHDYRMEAAVPDVARHFDHESDGQCFTRIEQ